MEVYYPGDVVIRTLSGSGMLGRIIEPFVYGGYLVEILTTDDYYTDRGDIGSEVIWQPYFFELHKPGNREPDWEL